MINKYHQIPIWSHKTWYYQSHSTFKVNAGVPYITESHGSQLPRISGTLVTIGKSLVDGLLMVIINITIWWYMLYQLLIPLTIIYIYTYIYCYMISTSGWWLSHLPLWKIMDNSSVGARWHSHFFWKVIIQPCSSHHQSVSPCTVFSESETRKPMGIWEISVGKKSLGAFFSQQKSPFQSEIGPGLRWLKMT